MPWREQSFPLLSSATLFFLALQEQSRTYFSFCFLLASLLLLIPLTNFYGGYALLRRAYYDLERDERPCAGACAARIFPWQIYGPPGHLVEESRLSGGRHLRILGVASARGLGQGRGTHTGSEDDEWRRLHPENTCFPPPNPRLSSPPSSVLSSWSSWEPRSRFLPAAYLLCVWDTAAARWLLLAGLGSPSPCWLWLRCRSLCVCAGFQYTRGTAEIGDEPPPPPAVLAIIFFMIAGCISFAKRSSV